PGMQGMAAKPKTIDAYLAFGSADKRAALEKPRKTIRAAATQAEERHSTPYFALDKGPQPVSRSGNWSHRVHDEQGRQPRQRRSRLAGDPRSRPQLRAGLW